uniref:NADH-ubiquinone oxidoreductase chain 5 n=1 Tax=Cryptonome barbada TaxID=2204078 RepID=A0A343YV55_9ANNE|nr:NADH dehydrogenase subunit 5 [Cryptonome barbada]AWN55976.1 NADH dehydrogenase subunit 5 [Cryptonome barbada]
MNTRTPSFFYSIILWATAAIMGPTALFLMFTNTTTILEWEILSSHVPIFITLIIDPWGAAFSSVVLLISANVMLFTSTYMSSDPFMPRFTLLVILFVLSMNLLIFIPHLIVLLIGWDGLGITSFILVIYYQNPKSLAAGMITALTNRVGDVMLLISIAWTLNQGHWTITNMWESPLSKATILLVMVAAMTKSAQIPFSSWLPAAMAAPTPVSALVHSSTLVTAGVFLLIRFYDFLILAPWFKPSLLLMATLTMFMAGIAASMETDLKKIIALSTLSQLGVMMASLGLGLQLLALFHLMTHALFKALLFLCAGSLIHYHDHGQDLRTTGMLTLSNPVTTSCMTVANLALCGSPFLAGFYSKDLILEMSIFNPTNTLILILFFFATGLTAGYSIRFSINLLWSERKATPISELHDHDWNLSTPMMVMTLGAILGGAAMNWALVMPYSHPILPPSLKMLPLVATVMGAWLASTLSNSSSTSKATLLHFPVTLFSSVKMWFLTPLSTQSLLKLPFITAHHTLKTIDQGWVEILGGQGVFTLTSNPSSAAQTWQVNTPTKQLSTTFMIMLPLLIIMML